ncbi:MAG TPA: mechanosensitive ion channel family protein [Bryobacteraceae bacterium]|nr:mechanosensitive ion channel family protein [Bryobacteraceae bacterium]
MTDLFHTWPALVRTAAILFGAGAIGFLFNAILFRAVCRIAARTRTNIDDTVIRKARGPLRIIVPILALISVLPTLVLPDNLESKIRHLLGLCLVASVAWLAVALVAVLEALVAARYSIDAPDNLAARRIRTQTAVLRRILVVLICLVAISIGLMSFPSIRQIGASLLASAGLAGLVVGLAARPVLANLLAGIQLALAGSIRLDDVVIIEGEWGRIEEITTTYVVVCIWDLRRLVVPLSYFIEKPFQNWTRISSELLGTVFLYTDYSVPVEDVRNELLRVLRGSDLWDGKVWGLQVTNATDRIVELRALMSAADSGKAWDLRCHVREALIAFLRESYPDSLPKTRIEATAKAPDESSQRSMTAPAPLPAGFGMLS